MPLITWKLPDGREISAEVRVGDHLMNAATSVGVPHIDGDCGGCLSCATCHVVVDAAWAERVGAASADEATMLEAAPAPCQALSRLSCQIVCRPELDGLVLHVPAQ